MSDIDIDRNLIDAAGTYHQTISSLDNTRIVCLVPSITELLCDLALLPQLVGRTGFCIHPKAGLAEITKVGGTKDVNIEKIRRLAPSHLIVNIDENEKPTVEKLAEFVPHIVVTHPNHPLDNLALYRLLGAIFDRRSSAEILCMKLLEAMAQVHADLEPKRVLYCIWKDPWMSVAPDTYIANMLALRAWKNLDTLSSPHRYPEFEWSDTLLSQVDVVLLSTEPYRFSQTDAAVLQQQIKKPVLLVDGEMLSWYGSRAILGMSYLRDLSLENIS